MPITSTPSMTQPSREENGSAISHTTCFTGSNKWPTQCVLLVIDQKMAVWPPVPIGSYNCHPERLLLLVMGAARVRDSAWGLGCLVRAANRGSRCGGLERRRSCQRAQDQTALDGDRRERCQLWQLHSRVPCQLQLYVCLFGWMKSTPFHRMNNLLS